MARAVHWFHAPAADAPAEVREAIVNAWADTDNPFEPHPLAGMTACGKRTPPYERRYWPFEATTDDALVTCRRCIAARPSLGPP